VEKFHKRLQNSEKNLLDLLGWHPLSDHSEMLQSINDIAQDLQESSLDKNSAYQYAVIRQILYQKGFEIELLAFFELG